MTDLEELKRLVAEVTVASPLPWRAEGTAVVDADGFVVLAYHRIVLALVNALPELIARVERAEAVLQEAIGRAEEIIERADIKAEDAGSDTEERAYYEGRMEAAISLSNILTGDTPNV